MHLWVRADGSAAIGLGHLMRSTALLEAAEEHDLSATLVTVKNPASVRHVRRYGLAHRFTECPADLEWMSAVRAGDLVVVDHYGAEPEELQASRRVGAAVLMIDDFGGSTAADVILRPSPVGIAATDDGGAVLLTGPKYALIRREFRAARASVPHRGAHLLVTMGGSDVAHLTQPLLEAATQSGTFPKVHALLGPEASAVVAPQGTTLIIDPPDVAAVLSVAGAAVSAAGSTTWELLCLGTPTALIVVADNQIPVARTAIDAGAALDLGTAGDCISRLDDLFSALTDPRECARLSLAGRDLVDGDGAHRVLQALAAVASG